MTSDEYGRTASGIPITDELIDELAAKAEAGFDVEKLLRRRVAQTLTGGSEMPFDQSKIGQVVAAQMEALEGRYGDECEIGNVCTIVEVLGPHGSDVSVRSSEARPHTTIGLLRMAEAMLLNRLGTAGRGEEE